MSTSGGYARFETSPGTSSYRVGWWVVVKPKCEAVHNQFGVIDPVSDNFLKESREGCW
jgi:hypothetical protein